MTTKDAEMVDVEEEGEFEDEVVILELNGVLDGESVRQAARNGQLVVRKADSDVPLIQIGSSVYTARWSQTLGTDLIFHTSNKIVHTAASVLNNGAGEFDMGDASMFQANSLAASQLDLVSVASTRLIGQKSLISTQ